MKISFTLLFILVVQSNFAQNLKLANKIDNQRTAHHQAQKNTRVWLIPPPFASTNMPATESGLPSWLIWEQIQIFNQNEKSKITLKQDLEANSSNQLLDYQLLTINNIPAVFYRTTAESLDESSSIMAWNLVNQRLDSLQNEYLRKNRWKADNLNNEQTKKLEAYLGVQRSKIEKELANTPAKKIHQMTLEIITSDTKVQIEAKYYADDK